MSGDTIQIRNCIICDDARQEVGGKAFLIGVYAGAMVNPIFPLVVPKFAVYIEAMFAKHDYQNVFVLISTPHGHSFNSSMGPVHVPNLQYPASLSFRFPGMQFPAEGDYQIYLHADDERFLVSTFSVVKPPIPAEKLGLV
jgi:hypothetical protein